MNDRVPRDDRGRLMAELAGGPRCGEHVPLESAGMAAGGIDGYHYAGRMSATGRPVYQHGIPPLRPWAPPAPGQESPGRPG